VHKLNQLSPSLSSDHRTDSVIPSLPHDLHEFAILLDVDGTILDLAPTPREVWVPKELREVLTQLSERTGGATAFVSGRPISELDLIFTPLQLPAVGGHGAEMRVRAGAVPGRPRIPPLESSIKRKFAEIAEAGPGIIIEDKGYSLALHYRLAPDKEDIVLKAVAAICAGLPATSIELLPGKSMVEIKQVGFNKASGVRELMTYPPFAGRRPLFIGDDVTDETVFAMLPEINGLPIVVGRRVPGVEHCFDNPAEVRRWLGRLSGHDGAARS
jgi:trehalose 6-phosphate phosphatase